MSCIDQTGESNPRSRQLFSHCVSRCLRYDAPVILGAVEPRSHYGCGWQRILQHCKTKIKREPSCDAPFSELSMLSNGYEQVRSRHCTAMDNHKIFAEKNAKMPDGHRLRIFAGVKAFTFATLWQPSSPCRQRKTIAKPHHIILALASGTLKPWLSGCQAVTKKTPLYNRAMIQLLETKLDASAKHAGPSYPAKNKVATWD